MRKKQEYKERSRRKKRERGLPSSGVSGRGCDQIRPNMMGER